MSVQQFLVIAEQRQDHQTTRYLARRIENEEVILVWMGRPSFVPPASPVLNRWSQIGLCNDQLCWIEEIGEAIPYRQVSPLSKLESLGLFSQILSGVLVLHKHHCVHGDLSEDNIFIYPDGTPLLVGIGNKNGSIEDDLNQLHSLAIRNQALNAKENLNKLCQPEIPPSLAEKLANQTLTNGEKVISVQLLSHPDTPELALFGEEELTQSRGLLEVPTKGEHTGVIYQQSEPTPQVLLYDKLNEWLEQPHTLSEEVSAYTAHQLQSLLTLTDPLTPPQTLQRLSPTGKTEHTEHLDVSRSETHSRTLHTPQISRKHSTLLLLVVSAMLLGFFLGRL